MWWATNQGSQLVGKRNMSRGHTDFISSNRLDYLGPNSTATEPANSINSIYPEPAVLYVHTWTKLWSCNCICCNCNCICIVFIVCSVSFIVCLVLCAVFCLSVVCVESYWNITATGWNLCHILHCFVIRFLCLGVVPSTLFCSLTQNSLYFRPFCGIVTRNQ
jgi:hypothetical protein